MEDFKEQSIKDLDIIAMSRCRIQWLGHVLHREKTSLIFQVMNNTPRRRKPVDRPELCWKDQVNNLHTVRGYHSQKPPWF